VEAVRMPNPYNLRGRKAKKGEKTSETASSQSSEPIAGPSQQPDEPPISESQTEAVPVSTLPPPVDISVKTWR